MTVRNPYKSESDNQYYSAWIFYINKFCKSENSNLTLLFNWIVQNNSQQPPR